MTLPDPFVHNLVAFVRELRRRGIRVGSHTTADLAAAATLVGLHERGDVYAAFRSIVVVRRTELAIFDEAFDAFFGEGLLTRPAETRGPSLRLPESEQPVRVDAPVLVDVSAMADELEVEVFEREIGGSYAERLAERDFADLTPDEAEVVRRLLAQMMWRPADARSRRWRPSRGGTRPDLRRTFRSLTGPAGDLMPIAMSERRRRRRPLLVIADISGSMERYTEMFMHFIHAAQGRIGRVEAFVFGTRLTRITREMRRRSPAEALSGVAEAVEDWSGGTRIGDSLATFNRVWSRRVTTGGPVCLVISDGWDCGHPDVLAAEMARLHRSVHRLVWLNPLASRPGYLPETRGMRAALPHVDDFLAAGTLLDLREVVRLLESVPTHRGTVRT